MRFKRDTGRGYWGLFGRRGGSGGGECGVRRTGAEDALLGQDSGFKMAANRRLPSVAERVRRGAREGIGRTCVAFRSKSGLEVGGEGRSRFARAGERV